MVSSGTVHQMCSHKGEEAPSSRHLWVGNLSPSVSQEELKQIFGRFGEIDKVFWHALKRYAFVYFIHQEDAEDAKNKLHGTVVGGFALRVEFAKGDQKIETRNLMDGAGISKEDRAHFSGSGPSYGSQYHPRGAKQFSAGSNMFRAIQGDSHTNAPGGSKVTRDGGEPTNVLWIGFPPNVKVEEQDLHRAFIPFAEIECITIFADRLYAFMELRSVEEAVIAKNALSGKLFNDPRFRINFSSSEIGPVRKENSSSVLCFPSIGDIGSSEACFMGHSLGFRNNALTMSDKFNCGPGMRPPNSNTKLSGGYENMIGMGNVQGGYSSEIGKTAGADHIPAPYRTSLPALSSRGRLLDWTGPTDVWDLPEEDILPRDFKRARLPATPSPVERFRQSSSSMNADPQHIVFTNKAAPQSISENFPAMVKVSRLLASHSDAHIQNSEENIPRAHVSCPSFSRPVGGANFDANFQPLSSISVEEVGCLSKPMLGVTNGGWKWEGNIAKGGTFICRTRCFPIDAGIDVDLPAVINCTARTDLDMLGKYILQAGDCGVVFFVPQGDAHVAPYRDFLHYLYEKNRAGVSKLTDGISLFLVPPSDFSDKILKVSRRDCLFGVVLKSQQVSNVGMELHHLQPVQHLPQNVPLLQTDVRLVSQSISQPLVWLQPPRPHVDQLPVQQLSVLPPGQSKELVTPSQEDKEYQGFPSFEGTSSLQTGVLASIITQLTMAQSANGPFSPELITSLTALLPQTQGYSGLSQPVPVGTDRGPAAVTFPGSPLVGGASGQTSGTVMLKPVSPVANGVSVKVINQPLGNLNPPLPPGLPPFVQEQNIRPYMCQAPQTIGDLPSFTFNPVLRSEPLAQQHYEPHASQFAVVDQGQNLASTTPDTIAQQNQTSSSYSQTLVLPPNDQLAQLFQFLVQNSQPHETSPNTNGQHEISPNFLLHHSFSQTPSANQVQVVQEHGTAPLSANSTEQQIPSADPGTKVTVQADVTKDEDVEKLRFQATLQLAQTLLQQMQQQDVGSAIRQ